MSRDKARVLLVEDDKNLRRGLQVALKNHGFDTQVATDPIAAFQMIEKEVFDLFVFDVELGELSGIDLFQKIRAQGNETPVIFISGHASLSEAVEAIRMGAYDFIEKPFSPDKLLITMDRCLEYLKVKEQLFELKEKLGEGQPIGQSPALKSALLQAQKVARTHSTVLITGESGSGKELLAKEIHKHSKVSDQVFVKINCAAIPENLVESELFGHEKGAFTGADSARQGVFEQANGGTLFLDEIGEMSLAAQAKVLRALQESQIQRLGSQKPVSVNVRLVAATNRDLDQEVREGNFREDLFYRINVFPLHSPALRERGEDIPLLVDFFLDQYVRANDLPRKFVSTEAMTRLKEFDWPGNVRELKNMVERLAIMSGQTIQESDLPSSFLDQGSPVKSYKGLSLKDFRRQAERDYIIEVLRSCKGNVTEAATVLEIERTYLHRKMQQLEIMKKEFFV